MGHHASRRSEVAPLAGAWIETRPTKSRSITGSRPSRARGLKLMCLSILAHIKDVAPLAGAWIETCDYQTVKREAPVAPLAGAWIETSANEGDLIIRRSRAPRGRVD